MVDQVLFHTTVFFSVVDSVELQSLLNFIIYCPWNCDSAICKQDLGCHVGQDIHVCYQFCIGCEFQAHRILESRMNLGYSLNHQC